jgi:spore maturation protein CgeB
LFEAAACGTPIISDAWAGIEEVLQPEREILIAHGTDDVVGYLRDVSDRERAEIASRARERVLQRHTAWARAGELDSYVQALRGDAQTYRQEAVS